MKLFIQYLILILVVVGILGYIGYSEISKQFHIERESEIFITIETMEKEEKKKLYPEAKEITSPDGFINTDGITVSENIGKKVILVDFWTYSCINCQRTLPYLNAWHEKYADKGLVILGVHTPEFQFEHKYENVLAAVKQYDIKYPVILDNDYSTWTAYKNSYWPRKYLIDIDGFIVYDHIGEGSYDETEKKIQELLEERMSVLGLTGDIPSDMAQPVGVSNTNFSESRSPEIYFGAGRNLYLGNGKSQRKGMQSLSAPEGIKTNILYLVGDWDFDNEYAENKSNDAKIIFRYRARDVFIVTQGSTPVQATILLDGKPLGKEKGSDVTEESTVMFSGDGLYKLVEGDAYEEHTLEIIIEDPGLQVFTFTFG